MKKPITMKREHPFSDPNPGKPPDTSKSNMWEKEPQNDAGVDELLAVLGYKVRSSDMMQVAQKIQQLEEVIGKSQADGLTHLGSETVHYNPSDLSTWLESMLSEFDPSTGFPVVDDPINEILGSSSSGNTASISSAIVVEPDPVFSDYDLKAIPGKAILSPVRTENNKRLKACNPVATTAVEELSNSGERSRPVVVVVDPQENGIRLVHTLMACAEAIQQQKGGLAEALVKQMAVLANSQGGSMGKVASHFVDALARRVFKIRASPPSFDDNLSETLEMHFYETCPYLKFAHFTANQAILDAFSGKKSVHVIDFSMKQGMQWPALMQALAVRPEGPPSFRLTGIGPPAPDDSDRLQEVGWKLAQFADSIHIKFEYRGFVANSLTDLEPGLLELKPETETLAVNSVFELHRLLGRPGAVEKVLGMVKEVKPVIFTVVEQEASHNSPVFVERFNEALHYYSTMFDSLESSKNNEDKMMTEVYLGRQIRNIVACDGVDRMERHESLNQWRSRLKSAELSTVHLGSNAFKQASMLLEFFAGGDGYGVEENGGCLMLGWHSRPLITTSAWRISKE